MSNVTNNNNVISGNDEKDESKKAQQQMIDNLSNMNQSLNDSLNGALGLNSFNSYLSDGMSMMSNAFDSPKDAIFSTPSGQQTMEKLDTFANQQNQGMQGAQQIMDFVANNPEVLAMA